ncbi:MAG: hypothetical protein JRI68_14195 [Deltaproteobacteria bacterium]|nr:hypothetical protein [Deltaproteobacteria bacterium]
MSREAVFAAGMQVRRHPLRGRARCSKVRRGKGGPTQRSLAWGLACLVGLLLAGRIASVGHLLLTRHVPCPHGELVHATHDEPRPTANHASEQGDNLAVSAALGPGEGHEHCNPPAVMDGLADQVQPAVIAHHIEWQLLIPTVGPAVGQSSKPLLALAPKSSPPRS